MNTTLEVLRDARASLADETEPFDFPEWSYCTCGHIYRAATGAYGAKAAVWPTGGMSCDPLYVRVICNAAAALGWDGHEYRLGYGCAGAETHAIGYVSRFTDYRSGAATAQRVTRDAAIEVLDEAIAHIEAAERKAMHAVAAPDAGLDGPSRTIIVEPVEAPRPTRTPAPEPDHEDTPGPTKTPVEEPVPA